MNGMKRINVLLSIILCFLILICLLTAGGFVFLRLSSESNTLEAADYYLSEQNPKEALSAYASLLKRELIPLGSLEENNIQLAEAGVLRSIDMILSDDDAVQQLITDDSLKLIQNEANHPLVSKSFLKDLQIRIDYTDLLKAGSSPDTNTNPISSFSKAFSDFTTSLFQQGTIIARDQRLINQAWEAFDSFLINDAKQIVSEISDEALRTSTLVAFDQKTAEHLVALHDQKKNTIHAGAWYSLVYDEVSKLCGDARYSGLEESFSGADFISGGAFSFAVIRNGKISLIGDSLGAEKDVEMIDDAVSIDVGWNHAIVLHADGSASVLGARQYKKALVSEWKALTAVAAGGFHTVGLQNDGKVIATGLNLSKQCNVTKWKNVIAIDAGLNHTVALLSDGTVVATGDNSYGQCDVSEWKNVTDISCGANFTLALTADYHVLAAGDNSCGQCDVSSWENVIAVDAGVWHSIGLLTDGRIITCGESVRGQRELDTFAPEAINSSGPSHSLSEYIYIGHEMDGPWFYCSEDGCVIAAMDFEAEKILATRADMICTSNISPIGILSGGGTEPLGATLPTRIARQNHSVLALTGDYFTFGYNRDGLQIRQGTIFKEEKDERGFAFYPDGTMRIVDPNETTATDLLSLGIKDSWVFGPFLILDGEACDIHRHPLSYNDVTMRSVVASICPYHHIAAAFGKSTLADCTKLLLDYGCQTAYNLDGGRSCFMIFLGNQINRTSYRKAGWRNLQDMVGFLTSASVPNP